MKKKFFTLGSSGIWTRDLPHQQLDKQSWKRNVGAANKNIWGRGEMGNATHTLAQKRW